MELLVRKAMELAFSNLEDHQKHVQSLKDYFKNELVKIDSEIKFNGETNSKIVSTLF